MPAIKNISLTIMCSYILSFCLFPVTYCVAEEINKNVLEEITKISQKINSYESYRYKVKNITYKKGKRKENIISYNYKASLNIRLEWLEPKKKRGQIAVYSDGNMKAAPAWLPFVIELSPDSKLGMDDANYPIYNSSLGSLLKQIVNDFDRATEATVEQEDATSIIYKIVNDTNSARIKISKDKNIPIYIEQFDLKGKMIDGGYFENFEPNIEYDENFFNL